MFSIFKESGSTLRNVEQQLDRMLVDCSAAYTLASSALFGTATAEDVADELWSLDKEVNRGERAIRRDLLIHASVRGAEMDQGLVLAYMSVAKDIERIGDYCKNLWDLAHIGAGLGGHPDSEKLLEDSDTVVRLLDEGRRAFAAQNEKEVHRLIPILDMTAAGHDEIVFALARSDAPASEAVPQALFYRFLKRIVSHMQNVLTSVVMPLDRIDFYKESKARSVD